MSARDAGVVELVVGSAVVIVAAVALLVPRRLASVVSFLLFGVLLSVLWALAGAPDVALAEAVLGTGVTGVLFVEAVTRSAGRRRQDRDGPPATGRGPDARPRRPAPRSWLPATATAGAALVLTLGLAPALWRVTTPRPGASPGLADAVTRALPRTGVDHGVTGVLLNLRSYDTLLEVAVLLVAVLVALAVGSQGSPAPRSPVAVPPLQGAATGLLVPALVLTAGWVLFAGSTRPGGAFQAGAVLAALLLLLHLADRPALLPGAYRSRVASAVGVVAFVGVAAVGPLLGGAFLELGPGWAGPVIVALETVLAAAIGASLALIAVTLRGGDR